MDENKKIQRRLNITLDNWYFLLNNRQDDESISDFINRIVKLYREMSNDFTR